MTIQSTLTSAGFEVINRYGLSRIYITSKDLHKVFDFPKGIDVSDKIGLDKIFYNCDTEEWCIREDMYDLLKEEFKEEHKEY